MKRGDLVSPVGYDGDDMVGVVISDPRQVESDNGVKVRVVEVDWIGWNLREDYSYPHLKVVSKC